MSRLTLILSLMVLAAPGVVPAETMVLTVGSDALGTHAWDGRALQALAITLPDSLEGGALVAASLEVRVACSEVAANGYGELQLAAWSPMGPVVPNGRSEYLSELVEGVQPQALVVDITPILKDALDAGASSVEIVAGDISPEALGNSALVALENEVGIWAHIHLQYNTLQ